MKAIFVMFDTLNRHMLSPYGCDWVHTPNFDRLAQRSVTFENCYVGSMPCMPARRELHTGRYNFLHRSWSPLEPFDNSMPQQLQDNGIYTHLVTDHQHYWEDGGATFHNRYSSYEFVRGQEGDLWKGHVEDPADLPDNWRSTASHDTANSAHKLWRQDWINRQYMDSPEKQSQTIVFDLGLEFIETNKGADNWFLQIETFDPHEPYFSHDEYKALYPHDWDGPLRDWPPYGPVTEPPEVVAHIRYEYAALLSMCDAQLGRLLDKMDALNLWEDTLLMVGTDHGFLLGEHDWWAKNIQPWYNINAHTPLFIWDPRSRVAGERRQSLVQMIDFPATLLDYFGQPRPAEMQGQPLTQTIIDDSPVREAALFGSHGGHVNVTDGRYVYMRAPVRPDNSPLFEYTLMPCHIRSRFEPAELQSAELAPPFAFTKGCPVLKLPARPWADPHRFGTLLFDVENDPEQMHPMANAEVEEMMTGHLTRLMRANDAPAEQYERLGLDN